MAVSFEGTHITYRELGQNVDRVALHLLDVGHKTMDRLIFQLPNVPETIYLYFVYFAAVNIDAAVNKLATRLLTNWPWINATVKT